MAVRLYVGNLPYTVTNDSLQQVFSAFGVVISAQVITDKFSGRSKGFGFVEMEDEAAANEAIDKLNGSDLEGRNITVNVARPREERPAGSAGGGFRPRTGGFNRRPQGR